MSDSVHLPIQSLRLNTGLGTTDIAGNISMSWPLRLMARCAWIEWLWEFICNLFAQLKAKLKSKVHRICNFSKPVSLVYCLCFIGSIAEHKPVVKNAVNWLSAWRITKAWAGVWTNKKIFCCCLHSYSLCHQSAPML